MDLISYIVYSVAVSFAVSFCSPQHLNIGLPKILVIYSLLIFNYMHILNDLSWPYGFKYYFIYGLPIYVSILDTFLNFRLYLPLYSSGPFAYENHISTLTCSKLNPCFTLTPMYPPTCFSWHLRHLSSRQPKA